MRAGFPACICSRIATALFSQRFRSHSSTALCASDPVCGGTVRTAGVPGAARECTLGQCGGWYGCKGHDSPADITVFHFIGGDVFSVIADSEFARSCGRRNLALVPYIICSTLCCETIEVLCG